MCTCLRGNAWQLVETEPRLAQQNPHLNRPLRRWLVQTVGQQESTLILVPTQLHLLHGLVGAQAVHHEEDSVLTPGGRTHTQQGCVYLQRPRLSRDWPDIWCRQRWGVLRLKGYYQ